MKFYEFNQHEYYALIMAETLDHALVGYSMNVCELEEGENHPSIITKTEALDRYKKAYIENCDTEEEKVIDFYNQLDVYRYANTVKTFNVLLVDSMLL